MCSKGRETPHHRGAPELSILPLPPPLPPAAMDGIKMLRGKKKECNLSGNKKGKKMKETKE